MARPIRVFAAAPYLGQNQEVVLEVRFCDRFFQRVTLSDEDGADRISITADVTGHETRYGLITNVLDELCGQYEEMNCEAPTKLLVMTWEKALNEAWSKVLREPEATDDGSGPVVPLHM